MLCNHLINANVFNLNVAINLYQLIDLFIYKIINQCYPNMFCRIKEPQTNVTKCPPGMFKITGCLARHQNALANACPR